MSLLTNRSLFIHVQKAGGMAVRRAMYLCDGPVYESGAIDVERHYGLPELLSAHPGVDNGRLTFGFVRHPVSWIVSRWAWAVRSGFPAQSKHNPKASVLWLDACWSDKLETFVEKYLERYPGVCTQTFYRMLGLWSGKPVQRIGRTENLVPDVMAILSDAGERFDAEKMRAIGKVNESKVDAVLPARLASRILDAERTMVERFYADGWRDHVAQAEVVAAG